jgi:hypothetical protein
MGPTNTWDPTKDKSAALDHMGPNQGQKRGTGPDQRMGPTNTWDPTKDKSAALDHMGPDR